MSRIIQVFGSIDDELLAATVEKLYSLNIKSGEKPIHLLINSNGGSIDVALSLFSLCLVSRAPIYTYNIGAAFSSGLLILLGGEKRYGTQESSYLTHPLRMFTDDGGSYPWDVESLGSYSAQKHERLEKILVDRTNLTKRQATKFTRSDSFYDAQAALQYGFIHSLVEDFPNDTMVAGEDDEDALKKLEKRVYELEKKKKNHE